MVTNILGFKLDRYRLVDMDGNIPVLEYGVPEVSQYLGLSITNKDKCMPKARSSPRRLLAPHSDSWRSSAKGNGQKSTSLSLSLSLHLPNLAASSGGLYRVYVARHAECNARVL